uniref:Uncharacterized protein n=1 Tax=Oryza barthii TaxID=65489 RepID=A0A0D3FM97_9ORYZ
MLTGGGDNGKVEMRWCWRMRMRHHSTWKKWIYQRLGWELLPFFLCNHCDTDRQALLRRIHRQQPWKHRIYLLWATEWRSAAKEDLVFALEEDLHAQQLITSSNFKRRGQVLGGGSGGGLDAAVLLPHDGANELADGVASLAASGSLNLGASSLDLAAGATTAAVPLPLPSSRASAAKSNGGGDATGRGNARGSGSANAWPRAVASPFSSPSATLRAVPLQARNRPAEPRSPLPRMRVSDMEG